MRDRLGVALLSAKLHENRLRWFGYMKRKTIDTPVIMLESLIVECKRSRGRRKRT